MDQTVLAVYLLTLDGIIERLNAGGDVREAVRELEAFRAELLKAETGGT